MENSPVPSRVDPQWSRLPRRTVNFQAAEGFRILETYQDGKFGQRRGDQVELDLNLQSLARFKDIMSPSNRPLEFIPTSTPPGHFDRFSFGGRRDSE